MNWTPEQIVARAAALDAAQRHARPVAALPPADAPDLDAAYDIQAELRRLRGARGDARVGCKLAFTSAAMRDRMGIPEPATGSLFASMRVADGGLLARSALIAPRLEAEIVFILRRPLVAGMSAAEALDAVEAVAPGIEIIDGRHRDFRFEFHQAVADSAGAGAFVVGRARECNLTLGQPDLREMEVSLAIDGVVVASGSTAAICDGPLAAPWVASQLASRIDLTAEAGAGLLLLGGSAIDPVPLGAGRRVEVRIAGLGSVGFVVGD